MPLIIAARFLSKGLNLDGGDCAVFLVHEEQWFSFEVHIGDEGFPYLLCLL